MGGARRESWPDCICREPHVCVKALRMDTRGVQYNRADEGPAVALGYVNVRSNGGVVAVWLCLT